MRGIISMLLFLLCCCEILIAQQKELTFERAFSNGELPITSIRSLLQDREGFIWIGTTDGLCRYDGVEVKTFRFNPQDSTSLSNNMIHCLQEGPDGRIWIGTAFGLNYYIPQEERVVRYKIDGKAEDNSILSMEIDKKGFLWYGTYGGLYRLNPFLTERLHFLPDEEQPSSIYGKTIWSIFEDHSGDLWFGTNNGASRLKNNDQFNFQNFLPEPKNPNGLRTQKVFQFAQQKDGTLWVGTDFGIFRILLDEEPIRFQQFKHDPDDPKSISDNFIECLHIDTQDQLWIGTYNSGLNAVEKDGALIQFKHYRADPKNDYSINLDRISAILEDRSGVFWVGTVSNLDKATPEVWKFRSFYHQSENSKTISHNIIKSVHRDTKGNLWVGTYNGLNLLKREDFKNKTENWQRFLPQPELKGSISNENVFEIYEDSQGYLWVPTFKGLNYINLNALEETTNFSHLSFKDGLPHRFIYDIIEIDTNEYWVATYGKLSKMKFNPEEPSKTTFQNYDMDESRDDALVNATTYVVEKDRFGQFWIGTFLGLSKYIQDDGLEYFQNYIYDPNDSTSLSNNSIRTLFLDSHGTLWIGTRSGLNRVVQEHAKDRVKFQVFGEREGLPNDAIQSIEEDQDGMLWIGTNKGIVHFDPIKAINGLPPVLKVYDENDGLAGNSLVFRASHSDKKGWLYFGTAGGLNYFKPEDLQESTFEPPLKLTGLKIGNESISPSSEKGAILSRSIDYTDTLTLKYWQDVIEISFAALDFNRPASIEYAYILEGQDKDWTYCGNRNTAIYTNLQAGKYQFKVKGTNRDGVWIKSPKVLWIQVLPPPWKTWWAYSFYILILIGIIFSFIRFKIQQQLRLIEEKNRIEKARLEERAQLRERNAADFHDELGHRLTKISLFLELANRSIKDPDNLKSYLSKIKINAGALSDGIRDLIWTLDPQKDSLYQTLLRLQDFGNSLFESSETDFSCQGLNPDWEQIELDASIRKHLLLLFKEAMNNCLKYAEASQAVLKVKFENNALMISFEDNGKGIDETKTQKGNGLTNMKSRAEKIKAQFKQESTLQKGTLISIDLPIEL